MTPKKLLQAGLAQMDVTAEEASVDQLLRFGVTLLEQNKVMNLTAIREPEEVVTKHFLDCAYLLELLKPGPQRLIDVGTGAGFPGIPLKLLRPELDVTLLDSLGKRIRFLQAYAESEQLKKVQAIHARAEDHAKKERESYDYATSRAVAQLPVLCELCLPLVKVGGQFLAMKSVGSDEELEQAQKAIRTLGGKISRVVDYEIPFTDITHRVIVIDKVKPTPAAYPRRFDKISKQPIK
jgi:16S rRNA (guanine527-N7)-methyltransferase